MTAVRTVNGALSSGTAVVSFAARYPYVEIKNLGSAVMYVRTDGTAPGSPWDDAVAVAAGERLVLPNSSVLWYQDELDINNELAANPGTTVKLAGTGTDAFSVSGIG